MTPGISICPSVEMQTNESQQELSHLSAVKANTPGLDPGDEADKP